MLIAVLFAVGTLAAVALLRLDQARRAWTVEAAGGVRPTAGPARRVICLAPNITETCFALGAGDQVVGVTTFCTFPPQATAKTRVGTLLAPNFEVLLKLRPDVVVGQEPNHQVAAFCEQHAIPFFVLKMQDMESIRVGIDRLGALLHRRTEAEQLNRFINASLDEIARKVNNPRPSALICIGRTPGSLQGIYSVGRNDFLAELLHTAGGENIFHDIERAYPLISKEQIVARQPQIIIDTFPGVELTARQRQQIRQDWQALPTLPAVQNNRIYILTDEYLHIPGPRVVQTAKRMAEICQPGGGL